MEAGIGEKEWGRREGKGGEWEGGGLCYIAKSRQKRGGREEQKERKRGIDQDLPFWTLSSSLEEETRFHDSRFEEDLIPSVIMRQWCCPCPPPWPPTQTSSFCKPKPIQEFPSSMVAQSNGFLLWNRVKGSSVVDFQYKCQWTPWATLNGAVGLWDIFP